MSTKNEEMVSIPASLLADLVDSIESYSLGPMKNNKMFQQLIRIHYSHVRLRDQPTKIEQWDIVEPKVGKNNLRAGNTAYGTAVVVSMSPFLLASEDEKCTWEKLDPEHFTIIGRAPEALIHDLNAKYGRYPIIG